NYAYVVCDEGTSSLQIIDLSYLPDSLHIVMENDSTFSRVHNLFIDEDNALMYVCSVQPSIGGTLQSLISMQVYSLADPQLPVLVYQGPNDIPEIHDAYVRDNIAYLNCGMDGFRVYDFSSPTTPVFIQNTNFYMDQGYNHQGWLSPDGTKYVFGDETGGTRLKLCTVDDNHNVTINKKFGSNYEDGSVAHNIAITDELAYVAYYNEGLRIFDLRTPIPTEIAYYDTYPIDEPLFKMQGAWGVYADFPSGRLLVSDRHTGLHLLEFNEPVFQVSTGNVIDVYPNPIVGNDALTVKFNVEIFEDLEISIYDLFGKLIESKSIENQTYAQFSLDRAACIYVVRVSYTDYLGDHILEQRKVVVSE
ncbi:MAG: choice-of-anchor B family protein, partial [Crocinitomicaceae bacterium]|nr:choice-of-anchor B family protein [Crocinitomicaceae bacterium]